MFKHWCVSTHKPTASAAASSSTFCWGGSWPASPTGGRSSCFSSSTISLQKQTPGHRATNCQRPVDWPRVCVCCCCCCKHGLSQTGRQQRTQQGLTAQTLTPLPACLAAHPGGHRVRAALHHPAFPPQPTPTATAERSEVCLCGHERSVRCVLGAAPQPATAGTTVPAALHRPSSGLQDTQHVRQLCAHLSRGMLGVQLCWGCLLCGSCHVLGRAMGDLQATKNKASQHRSAAGSRAQSSPQQEARPN